jgi:prevent-host-death family protein
VGPPRTTSGPRLRVGRSSGRFPTGTSAPPGRRRVRARVETSRNLLTLGTDRVVRRADALTAWACRSACTPEAPPSANRRTRVDVAMDWSPTEGQSLRLRSRIRCASRFAPRVDGLRWFRDSEGRDIRSELPGWPERPTAVPKSSPFRSMLLSPPLHLLDRGRQSPLCTHGTLGTLRSMSQMPIESIRDVRAHLAEVVERADHEDVPTVITRRGKQVAAVVSIEVLRKYQLWEEREINRIIDERMANPAAGVPMEEVMRETLARSE